MNAIPTTYGGARFRSRLEAKWAAFFDLCEWRWEYEPIDLDGYIPDFILMMRRPILVEVKPFMDRDDPIVWEAMEKIEHSGWGGPPHDGCPDGNAIIAGSVLLKSREAYLWKGHPALAMGVLGLGDLATVGRCMACKKMSFSSDTMSYSCEWCGDNHGGSPIMDRSPDGEVLTLWREAGNIVQWMRTQ